MKLNVLLQTVSLHIKKIVNKPSCELTIRNLVTNHLHVRCGDLFICLKGATVDGHQFARAAVQKGAVAIIAERFIKVSVPVIYVDSTHKVLPKLVNEFYQYPSQNFTLFGVTGTNGKTTVSYLLNDIFSLYNHHTGLIGTIEIKINNKNMPSQLTTPDPATLQKIMAKMVEHKVDTVFMEVSSHALSLGRIHGCDFDVAIFTNLTQDHLDFHQTMENYLHAKSLLFSQLGSSLKRQKYVVLNLDDPASEFLMTVTAQPVLTYSCKKHAHVIAKDIEITTTYTKFLLVTPVGEVVIRSPLIGMFNVSNMLAAATAAIAKDVPLPVIKSALENVENVPGRFEVIEPKDKITVIVDYAHTPDSLKNVLQTIQSFAIGKISLVVGTGGDRDRKKRPLMGEVAVQYADEVTFTSDNPRTEDPEQILKDMVNNLQASNYTIEIDRKKAIHRAIQFAEQDDVILIAGKGHETYQEIHGVKYDFDDRKIAKEALNKREK